MPDPCRSNQIGVFSQGGQRNLRFLEGYVAATIANGLPDPGQKQGIALHHAATENDGVGGKQGDQICQTQPQIMRLALDGAAGEIVAFRCQFTDSLSAYLCPMRVIRGGIRLQPGNHRRTCGQRFPTSSKTAGALRTGGIEKMMANLRV